MSNQIALINDEELDVSIIENADKLPDIVKHWPQDAQAMFEYMKADFEKDYSEEESAKLAMRALLQMSNYGGGMQFYLPKKDTFLIPLRDIQVWSLFNGRNVRELAKRFDLTPARIYGIIAEQRKIEIQRSQFSLF
ncbi:transcriptional regulator [Vibrio parahaemolyticus]|uniref:Mor transcription activator family protein n=1 Tax=Vibrio harveyi group TaxID=717610 RepID=UPI000CE38725|nr:MULTISPECIES: Mor transcription activator family protein [Vibrio harveyi group]MCE7729245.1 transcriptional regulator [Vibrio campbellii]MCR9653260.1 transcriptional regulator [Vibrio parahaemolyticus]QLK44283.1 transcriptional regulator [Vibrio owensii]